MDGEKRKRKERDDDEEEEGEEEKMKKFFDLIRSTRAVRELIMSTLDKSELPYKQKNINIINEEKLAPARAWRPVFLPEDFIEDGGLVTVLNQAGPSRREGENKEREEEDKEGEGDEREKDDDGGLDLKLSL